MTTKYFLVTDVMTECHILSIYEEPISKMNESEADVFADVYSIYDRNDIGEIPAEYNNKKIAKVIFKDGINPKEWENRQGCNLEPIDKVKYKELANTSRLYNFHRNELKNDRNRNIKSSIVTLSNGVKLEADDLALNRITAIVTCGLMMALFKIVQTDEKFGDILKEATKITVPFKDSENNFQNLNITDLTEAQKLILDNLSRLFQEYS